VLYLVWNYLVLDPANINTLSKTDANQFSVKGKKHRKYHRIAHNKLTERIAIKQIKQIEL
jgi:hypothetical protein